MVEKHDELSETEIRDYHGRLYAAKKNGIKTLQKAGVYGYVEIDKRYGIVKTVVLTDKNGEAMLLKKKK